MKGKENKLEEIIENEKKANYSFRILRKNINVNSSKRKKKKKVNIRIEKNFGDELANSTMGAKITGGEMR